MKIILSIFVSIIFLTTNLFADCQFSTGIKPGPNDTFIYSKDCHLKVGQIVEDDKVKSQQVEDLTKAIALKTSALNLADKRADDWMDTSLKLEKNVQDIDNLKKENEWIYFGLGALTVIATGFSVASLTNRH